MSSAAELRAQLLAKREAERVEQERLDAEFAIELARLEEQEEEETSWRGGWERTGIRIEEEKKDGRRGGRRFRRDGEGFP